MFAAIALFVVLGPFRPRQLDEFLARGGASPTDVDVKMVWVGAPPDAGDLFSIPPDAELAFAYANRSNHEYLMLFSIDDREHVAWYYPAWTDPNTNPLAIPIDRTMTMKELPEAVRQHYDGLQIHVMALFLTSPLSVTQVEQNISDSPDNRPHIRGALAWESDLRIRRP